MRFTYETHDSLSKRLDITCNFNDINEDTFRFGNYVLISDNMSKSNLPTECLKSVGDYHAWREQLEKEHAWKPQAVEGTLLPPADPINPSHYQAYMYIMSEDGDVELQWLEAMQYLPAFQAAGCFEAALELQIRKYLDRNGKKDESVQELSKAMWYLRFLIAYKKNKGPIRVADIDEIISNKI